MAQISTLDAAARLGITPERVRQLIASGELPAERVARDYLIDERDLEGAAGSRASRRAEVAAAAGERASRRRDAVFERIARRTGASVGEVARMIEAGPLGVPARDLLARAARSRGRR